MQRRVLLNLPSVPHEGLSPEEARCWISSVQEVGLKSRWPPRWNGSRPFSSKPSHFSVFSCSSGSAASPGTTSIPIAQQIWPCKISWKCSDQRCTSAMLKQVGGRPELTTSRRLRCQRGAMCGDKRQTRFCFFGPRNSTRRRRTILRFCSCIGKAVYSTASGACGSAGETCGRSTWRKVECERGKWTVPWDPNHITCSHPGWTIVPSRFRRSGVLLRLAGLLICSVWLSNALTNPWPVRPDQFIETDHLTSRTACSEPHSECKGYI